jgi:hypothetical protein
MPQIECPDEFAEVVLGFIASPGTNRPELGACHQAKEPLGRFLLETEHMPDEVKSQHIISNSHAT